MKKLVSILLVLALCLSMCAYAEDTWVCPKCGDENTDAFCGECGTKKPEWTCASCGAVNTKNFCTNCGAKKPVAKLTSDVKAGDTVGFGHYEQDNNISNGQEAIEWLVLDVQDGKALLLSRYGLDSKAYNEKLVDITWEKCTLRTWLNKDFLNAAFTISEQGAIETTVVDNSGRQRYSGYKTNGGNNTEDKIFLLSYAEAWTYFSSDEARKCVPTAYAIAQGAYQSSSEKLDGKGTCWWWLRSPGLIQYYAAYVDPDGSRDDYSVLYSDSVVRPALWVDIESGI